MTNPILPGFHPDPSICRVGDEHYLVTSTFTYFPGVPIYRSTDLVHWEQIGNVLDRPSQLDLGETGDDTSMGIYAPTLRHHDGRFWMITSIVSGGGLRNFFVTATDPAGPWSDPVWVDILAVDPDLAWDDDGNCWVHAALGSISRTRIDDRTGAVLDPPVVTWSGTGLQFPEAPHLFRRGETWYLLIAEGGTAGGHAVSIARGPSPTGPWEACPANPILSHRSTDLPVQNTGHGDLVEAPDGSWSMVLLGVRPRGATPGFHVLGRETFLVPVRWVDGWPEVGEVTLDLPSAPAGPVSTTFDRPFGPEWLTVRRPLGAVASLDERAGALVLHGGGDGLDATFPAFVGRRQQDHRCVVRASVDGSGAAEAGLALRLDEHHHYEVAVAGGSVVARARIGPLSSVVASAPVPAGPVVLRLETADGLRGPDVVRLGYESGDGVEVLAELDGRYLSTEVGTGFVGRVVGMYAVGGPAAFAWFEYDGLDAADQ